MRMLRGTATPFPTRLLRGHELMPAPYFLNNEFAKCYRSVPRAPTAPAEPRQQRPSAHEQQGGATRLGYYDEPCHEAGGIWGSRPRVHICIENARNPVAKWTDGIKHGRRSSAEVAHIEQQIAQGRVVEKRGGQRDDDIEILRAAWRTCERAGERKRATGEYNSVISAYIVGIGRAEPIICGAGGRKINLNVGQRGRERLTEGGIGPEDDLGDQASAAELRSGVNLLVPLTR